MSEFAMCPHCGEKNWDVHELCPYAGDYECEFCNKEFFLNVQPSITVEAIAKQGDTS